ncbi:MAG: YbaB/EbfC family nucleoid-associated protein [bacterium]|nr:YbaB/EbfC family nucleoid-associated protein [bacterium]
MGRYKGFSGSGMNTSKNNMNSVIKQAQKMQEEMEKVQSELEEKTVEAAAGGGAVKAVVSGKKQIISLTIDPEAVDPEDVETLQDMITLAVNEAISKADEMMAEGMSAVTGGLNIPGLF